jgi:hypothetical protein
LRIELQRGSGVAVLKMTHEPPVIRVAQQGSTKAT